VKVFGDIYSGNCYKIRLLLSLLEIKYDWIHVDILKKETQTAEYLQKNPNGQIPLLELEDGCYLAESNAILNYLAEGTKYLPSDRFSRAKVLEWQFFEQYSHEPYIAVARYIARYLGLPEDRVREYESKQERGHKALQVMERQLSQSEFFVGNELSIADISLYAYTHVAHEGGFDLQSYPAIREWIERIIALPNYVAME